MATGTSGAVIGSDAFFGVGEVGLLGVPLGACVLRSAHVGMADDPRALTLRRLAPSPRSLRLERLRTLARAATFRRSLGRLALATRVEALQPLTCG